MFDAGLKLKIFSTKDLLLESWYMKRAHTCTMKNLPFEGHVPSGFHCKSSSRANGADPAYKFSNFNKMPRWESRESNKLLLVACCLGSCWSQNSFRLFAEPVAAFGVGRLAPSKCAWKRSWSRQLLNNPGNAGDWVVPWSFQTPR